MTTKTTHRGISLHRTKRSVTYAWPASGAPLVTNEDIRGFTAWVDSFNGVQNPSWKAQVKAQVSATTPASGVEVRVSSLPYMMSFVEGAFGSMASHNYQYRYYRMDGEPIDSIPSVIQFGTASSLVINRVTARAYSLYLEKAKSAISSFESGQDFGEIRQTIESVLHPFSSLRKHVESYFVSLKKVKHKYKTPRKLSKALADTYLEWTFGWNPLCADIADGIVGLSRVRMPSVSIESHAKEVYRRDSGGGTSDITQGFYHAQSSVTSEYSMRLKGTVNAYYKDGTPPGLLQELQLLPEDFIPTAWDLLPYSFVADYFVNVGDVLRALSFPTSALRWTNQSVVDKVRTLTTFSSDRAAALAAFPSNLGYALLNQGMSCANFDVESRLFSRTAISSLVPPISFSLPMSVKPWENIAALLAGGSRPLVPFY